MMEVIEIKGKTEKYPKYKDSGIEWLGKIPNHWKVVRLKHILFLNNDKELSKESSLPYVGMENIQSNTGKYIEAQNEVEGLANNFKKNDILFGKLRPYLAKVYLAEFDGLCSTEFLVYTTKYPEYFHKLLLSSSFIDLVNSSTYGAKMPRASSEFIGNQHIPIPPIEEQTAIANFLDDKTAKINTAIAQKEKMIALLQERRQIIIQRAVTKGLDPEVGMKDSGVEWIGEIPAHWEVKRLKYVLVERNERSETGEETLFMMSQVYGLVIRADYHAKAEVASSNIGNKKVYKNDLVFNKLKAHLGVFFKSEIDEIGLVSPDYAVYRSLGVISDLKFLEYLFRHPAYIAQFICKATGIVEGLIRLYTDDLFSIPIPVPTKEEQKEILEFINIQSTKIDQAITLQQQQIEKLKEYKAILINDAVTGKIKIV